MLVHCSHSAIVPVMIIDWGDWVGDDASPAGVAPDPPVKRLAVLARPDDVPLDRSQRVAVFRTWADRGDQVRQTGAACELAHRVKNPVREPGALKPRVYLRRQSVQRRQSQAVLERGEGQADRLVIPRPYRAPPTRGRVAFRGQVSRSRPSLLALLFEIRASKDIAVGMHVECGCRRASAGGGPCLWPCEVASGGASPSSGWRLSRLPGVQPSATWSMLCFCCGGSPGV
jgi:hypothetical protein